MWLFAEKKVNWKIVKKEKEIENFEKRKENWKKKKCFFKKRNETKNWNVKKIWELHLQNVTTIRKVWPENWHKIEKTG